MKNLLYPILIICCYFTSNANHKNKYNSKSELHKEYDFFENKILENKKDTANVLHWAKIWLEKANSENNNIEKVKAYKIFMHWSEKKFRMIYADSLLNTAIETKDDAIIGSAYLTIGAAHYNNKEYKKALDLYIKANTYIVKTNDKYLIHKLHYTFAQTKYYLGYYDEAIALFTESLHFFKEENETAYIKSLHALGLCYNLIGRYDLAEYHNKLGIRISKETGTGEMLPYFINAEGINHYSLKKYDQAIRYLKESLITIEQTNDFANQVISWFYLGKCYWELQNQKEAIVYFEKAEHTMTKNNFIRPDLRENYELLMEYFKNKKDITKQLFYVNKLLEIDKILENDFKYISYKIHKEYDTASLLNTKENLEKQLHSNKNIYVTVVVALSIGITILIIIFFFNQRKNKRKFQEIIQRVPEKIKFPAPPTLSKTIISAEVTKQIVQNIEKFEKSKKFLEKDVSLVRLAYLLETNTKYTSIVIAEYRGKKITTYLNDLKIDYIVEMLTTNKKFRNYTNKALADEAGFGSTQIFTKAFITRNKISPTFFIKELNKQITNINL